MPSIKDAIQKNAQRIAAGEDLVQPAPKDVGPASSDGPFVAPASPVVTGLPVRGAYTPNLTLHTDFQNNTQGLRTGPNIRSATFPSPQTSSSSIVSKIVAAATAAVSSLVIKVNNALAPNQNLINLLNGTGMIITVDAAGNIVFNSTSSGDGLTHSAEPWPSDPAYFIFRDDFYTSTQAGINTNLQINTPISMGWYIRGAVGSASGQTGGLPPNMGQIWWSNSGTQSQVGALVPNLFQTINTITVGAASDYFPDMGLALFDTPGWELDWVFKIENPRQTANPFSLTKQSTYIGLMGISGMIGFNSSNLVSRPDQFFGVRYDTSAALGPFTLTSCGTAAGGVTVYTGTITGGVSGQPFVGRQFTVTGFDNPVNNGTWDCTASSSTTLTLRNPNGVTDTHTASITSAGIADTVFVLEAVENQSYALPSRNNTQGTTQSTGITPTVGTWYRLNVTCAATGLVSISLFGGGASSTLSTTVSTMSITGSGTWLTGSAPQTNLGQVTYTVGNPAIVPPLSPFSTGSHVTVAGFSGSQAPLNGLQTLLPVGSASLSPLTLQFDISNASFGGASVNGSLTGYPAVVPCVIFGQDDTASPTSQIRTIFVDFVSLVWNPNLGPSAPGTPTSTLSRYW